MKRLQSLVSLCVCVLTLVPMWASAQTAKDPVLRDETVDSLGDGIVADALNAAEGVAKDSEQAALAEARRDLATAKSLVVREPTPTLAADSDQAIERDVEKLESLSQE